MPTTKFFIFQITSQKKECEKKRELFPPPRNISLFGLLIWEKTVSPTAFFKKRQGKKENSSQRERRDVSHLIPCAPVKDQCTNAKENWRPFYTSMCALQGRKCTICLLFFENFQEFSSAFLYHPVFFAPAPSPGVIPSFPSGEIGKAQEASQPPKIKKR